MLGIRARNVLTDGFVLLNKHLHKIVSADTVGLVPTVKTDIFVFLALHQEEVVFSILSHRFW